VALAPRTVKMGGDGDIKRWFQENGFGDVKKRGGSFGGSGWASTARWEGDDRSFFVKASSRPCDKMFMGEAAGLRAMRAACEGERDDDDDDDSSSERLVIPEVFVAADYPDGKGSYLIMEFLNLGGRGDAASLGRAVAKMHLVRGDRFGFECDNTIGATPQPNGWSNDWPDFFREKRLAHQVTLAGDSAIDRVASKLLPRIREFFSEDDEEIYPSIIHGDLWSGNIGTANGRPTIFDPACYYAHHEAEWGMSWCASLGPNFWKGYREFIPEAQPGFKLRRPLYEAYHQLNHYNLFGGGYRSAAISCMDQALRNLDGD